MLDRPKKAAANSMSDILAIGIAQGRLMPRPLRSNRRQFTVEGLESRQLLALTYGFVPLGSAGIIPGTITPSAITTGADGNVWFTIDRTTGPSSGIGELDTRTWATTYDPTPSQDVDISSIIPVGNLLFFSEYNPSKFTSAIGVIDSTSHVITEIPVNYPYAAVFGITLGKDGNLYFTDVANDAIGKFAINDPSHSVTETKLPKLNEAPLAITTAPNGTIYYGFTNGLGSYNPTTQAITQVPLAYAPYFSEASATSFAVGGDGRLYFSAVDVGYGYDGPVNVTVMDFGLGSLDPTAPLTTAGLAFYSSVAGHPPGNIGGYHPFSITAEPDGNIAYTRAPAEYLSPSGGGGEVGEFNVTTHTTTTTPLPDSNYNFSPTGLITAAPNGALCFAATGAIGVATSILSYQATIVGSVINETYSNLTIPAGTGGYSPLYGQLVYLDLRGDGRLDPGDPTAVTNFQGTYVFNGLIPGGTYTVRVALRPGSFASAPSGGGLSITAVGGQVTYAATDIGVGQNSVLEPLTINLSPFGTNPRDVQTAEATAYYHIILGRAPDASGLAAAVAYLKSPGSSLKTLAQTFLNSTEYLTTVVADFYANFLGRTGSAAEVESWVTAMQQHGLSTQQVAAQFLTSPEFDGHQLDSDFPVQVLYEDLLGRQGSPDEIAGWYGAIPLGLTPAQLVASIMNSTESLNIAIGIAANVFTPGFPIDTSPYVAQVQAGTATLAVAISEIASRPEFVTRANAAVPG